MKILPDTFYTLLEVTLPAAYNIYTAHDPLTFKTIVRWYNCIHMTYELESTTVRNICYFFFNEDALDLDFDAALGCLMSLSLETSYSSDSFP